MLVARCSLLRTVCWLLVAFPLSLFVNPAERLGTAPYNLIARVPRWRGGQGVVTLSLSKGCPPERLETVPYNRHYKNLRRKWIL